MVKNETKKATKKELHNTKNVSALKMLGVDMINKAKSGHPGIVLGAANMMHTLFDEHMNIDPLNPNWLNRDRFVMSAGHGSALLYGMLHLAGYELSIEDLKNFRQLKSRTPGHPENHITKGVDAASGPLGQGIAHAVGIALSEEKVADMFNTADHKIFNHHTFAICGDGDLQEGVAQEAMSLAGNLKLSKLIILYDSNKITLDGNLEMSNTEDNKKKMESMNWNYIIVEDGENASEVSKAITAAKKSSKPTMIEVKTIIGKGAPNEGTHKVHGSPLGDTGRAELAKSLNWKNQPFEVDEDVYDYFSEKAKAGNKKYDAWNKTFVDWSEKNPKLAETLAGGLKRFIDVNYEDMPEFKAGEAIATRASSGKIFEEIQKKNLTLIGGSADLSSSTKVKGVHGDFDGESRKGNNINYGIREFAMAAINNGISLHGVLKPFSSGFFVFSDYAKPAIRLSSLMQQSALHIYTHDSVAVGEDGPTHQPVEQIAGFRAQPDLYVFRPADANEVKASYKVALSRKLKPSLLVLSRQNLKTLDINPEVAEKGGYIIKDSKTEVPARIILASGSEVEKALEVAEKLDSDGIDTRVVSMPCIELFEEQDLEYKKSILPISLRNCTYALEMSSDSIWYRYADKVAGINNFGLSAPGDQVINEKGFGTENLYNLIKN